MFNRNQELFVASDGSVLTAGTVLDKLRAVGAEDCEILYVHSELMFGTPCHGLKRKELLQALSEVFLELHVKTLLLATYTFSFANHEPYDVNNSKTSMGVLLEYMRKLPQVVCRSEDPLLSVALIGEDKELLKDLPHHSLGADSVFDRIHRNGKAKFLIFGGEMGESLTCIHHVEKMLNVPYRYDQYFTGTIIAADGSEREETWSIQTACGGVLPRNFYEIEEDLVAQGRMKREKLGDGKVACVDEAVFYQAVVDRIGRNGCYFLKKPYTPADLTHEYKYGKNGERVTHC